MFTLLNRFIPMLKYSSSMAFTKSIAHRLFNICRISSQSLTNCRITSPSIKTFAPRNPDKAASDPGDDGISRRFLHRKPVYQSSVAGANQMLRSLPNGETILEKLRVIDIGKERLRLDGLIPPPVADEKETVTVEDARKLLRISQIEMAKASIRQVEKACVSYDEFLEICSQGCWNKDHAKEVAKMLDQSGNVVVLGSLVFLRPEQVVKALQGLIPGSIPNPSDRKVTELEAMEEQKSAIDKNAEALVRRELWFGLGYFIIQTAAFMRLTFWELSWDVMEPICFYVTSIYCMGGYAFFLRTSKEPSFEGFYQSRFSSKQKRLMKLRNFDIRKYNELWKTCHPNSIPTLPPPVL